MYSTYSTQNRNRRRYESSEDIIVYSKLNSSSNALEASKEIAKELGRSYQSILARYWYMKYNRIIPFAKETVVPVNLPKTDAETLSKIVFNIKGVEITMIFKQDV